MNRDGRRAGGRAADRQTDRHTDRNTDHAADRNTDRATRRATDGPAGRPVARPPADPPHRPLPSRTPMRAISAAAWRDVGRDGRDTLFLLGVLAFILAPHVSRLPLWCTGCAALALVWRAVLAWRQGPLPGRVLLALLLAAAVGLTLLTHGTLLGQGPGVTLIVALTALKTLELRARRDAFVIFFLGFFLVLTQFLYSQSLPTAVGMALAVWGLLTALVLAHLPVGRPPLRLAAGIAGRAALIALPIMVVLFVLFPRIGPLWGRPDDALATTGLSSRMRLGEVAELALDDSIAMRLRFPDGPPPQALYFRGPVLSRYDGRQWQVASPWQQALQAQQDANARGLGPGLRYEVTLEPTRLNTLPLLEATLEVQRIDGGPGGAHVAVPSGLTTRSLWWQLDQPVSERLRILARAWPAVRYGPTAETAAPGGELLELPERAHPGLRAWALDLKRQLGLTRRDADALAAAVLRHIRTQPFVYTLSPGTYEGDTLDEFWLQRRLGFCEHYAAAFVVAMRAMGVPARIVTGYQGAERNPVDDTWVVRNRDAHAWAEYWQPGTGWQRADPTAAVAPERVERGRSLRPAPGLVAGVLDAVNPGWVGSLRSYWEAVNNGWNQWVLNYSRSSQFNLLERLGVQSPDWVHLGYAVAGLLAATSLAGLGWAWWSRTPHDPWLLALERARLRVVRAGGHWPAHWPALTAAQALVQRHGAAARPLAEALQALDAQRYAAAVPAPSARRAARRRLARAAAALAADLRRQRTTPRTRARAA